LTFVPDFRLLGPRMGKIVSSNPGLQRLQARTRIIGVAWRSSFVVFLASAGFAVFAASYPQDRVIRELERQQVTAEELERQVQAEREHRAIELRALREDPAYLELLARDRLDSCLEGEKVLRIRRDP
jgi:hypothetical protein